MNDLEKYVRLSNLFNYHLDLGNIEEAEEVSQAMQRLLIEHFDINIEE